MIICICGKSGSGKSTIANLIKSEYPNSIHIDIDKIGHKSHNDDIVKNNLIKEFGSSILKDNSIDRKELGNIVFNNIDKMKKLEDITWDFMEKEIDKIISSNKDKLIILDWLLIPRTKYFELSYLKVLLDIPYEIRKERIFLRDNINEEDFLLREKNTVNYDQNKFDIILKDNNIDKIKERLIKYE